MNNLRFDIKKNPQPVIECRGLTKSFRDGKLSVDVFQGINLSLQMGEQIAIVGASGVGKSTLLHLLGGLDKPTKGEVRIAGKNIHELSEKERCKLRNQKLGFVYQFHHLLPEFTALENVAMPLMLSSLSREAAMSQAAEILNKVGLSKRLEHRLSEMSGGERQRTAIARALVTKPACIMADEPTGNLDNKTSAKVYGTMCELNREMQTSFIIVTHDIQLTNTMDRVFILENGSLLQIR